MDIEETRSAYLRATEPDVEELKQENTRLKLELDALQQKCERIISTFENSVEAVLRVAREGRSED